MTRESGRPFLGSCPLTADEACCCCHVVAFTRHGALLLHGTVLYRTVRYCAWVPHEALWPNLTSRRRRPPRQTQWANQHVTFPFEAFHTPPMQPLQGSSLLHTHNTDAPTRPTLPGHARQRAHAAAAAAAHDVALFLVSAGRPGPGDGQR